MKAKPVDIPPQVWLNTQVHDHPPQVPPLRRLPIVLITAGVIVVFAIAAAVFVVTGKPTAVPKVPAPIIPMVGHNVCADHIVVYLETDERMAQLAQRIHTDPRARKLYTETKQEAFERFEQMFKDQPELRDNARPEALPASVTIVPGDDVDLRSWADELHATIPEATRVQPIIGADVLATLTPRYGTADLSPPCPPSGEWN